MLALLCLFAAQAAEVADVSALRAAVAAAAPGETITLAPGTYRLDSTLSLATAGTPDAPITLTGPGATIESDTVEALKVRAPYWVIADLTFVGVCASDDDCEHALHIVGDADHTTVSGNTLIDFNAQIKGNGEEVDGAYHWPDDVLIIGNDFHDTRGRVTANPVTKIDVVGGQRWVVEANRIADFWKDGGDTVSYAAFFKGNSKDGRFARNLVICADTHSGGARVGLSLGGGGTSPDSICEDGTCTPEHQRGHIENNLIVNCSDVGVYLNEAADSFVDENTLYATSGIDVRFEASTVTLRGNVLDGRIRERDGGSATLGTNWAEVDLAAIFADPAALDFTLIADPGLVDALDPIEGLTLDFCGGTRDDHPDGGAIEYSSPLPCDTSTIHPPAAGGDTGGAEGGGDGSADDSATPDVDDTQAPTADAAPAAKDGGCGCASTEGASLFGLPGALALLLNRRRRP